MKNKFFVIVCLALILLCMCGCADEGNEGVEAGGKEEEETQQIARLEVYDASSQIPINTIDEEEIISEFNMLINGRNDDYVYQDVMQNRLADQVEGSNAVYRIIAYKNPAAIINDGSMEEIYAIIVYEDSRVVKMQVSADNIKNMPLSEQWLTWYEELSDNEIDFLRGLAEN